MALMPNPSALVCVVRVGYYGRSVVPYLGTLDRKDRPRILMAYTMSSLMFQLEHIRRCSLTIGKLSIVSSP